MLPLSGLVRVFEFTNPPGLKRCFVGCLLRNMFCLPFYKYCKFRHSTHLFACYTIEKQALSDTGIFSHLKSFCKHLASVPLQVLHLPEGNPKQNSTTHISSFRKTQLPILHDSHTLVWNSEQAELAQTVQSVNDWGRLETKEDILVQIFQAINLLAGTYYSMLLYLHQCSGVFRSQSEGPLLVP